MRVTLEMYLSGFLKFWSAVFIIVATLLMLIKHETDVVSTPDAEDASQDASMTQSVAEAYMQLWKIVHLPAVLSLIVTLLTIGVKCEYYVRVCFKYCYFF